MNRFVVALCFVAMLGAWAPHSHSDSPVASPTDLVAVHHEAVAEPSITSDDAHEEHSSRVASDARDCLFCRSSRDREGARAPETRFDLGPPADGRLTPDHGDTLRRFLALGSHPTRAPPIG